MTEKSPTELILLNIGFAIHNADWNYKNVHSPFARIYLVKEGMARLHLPENNIQELVPDHLYFIPPFTQHSYECSSYYTLFYIHIYETPSSTQRILEDYVYPVQISACKLDILLINRLIEINPERELKLYDPTVYDNASTLIQSINKHSQTPMYAIMETKGILFQILSHFFKHATDKYKTTDNRIRGVLRYIRKNIDRQITLEELMHICYLSKDHFIRLFKKEMNTTPIKYINQRKIEKAQLMLITGKQSVKDIAYSLSFENVYYFNRLFKKNTGITPIEYKKQF